MVIMGITSYPTESATEIGKRFQEAPSFPDYLTRRGPYILNVRGEGIQGFSIFELDRSRMAEAVESISNYYVKFMGVPGFTFSVNVCLEPQEALKMIGLG